MTMTQGRHRADVKSAKRVEMRNEPGLAPLVSPAPSGGLLEVLRRRYLLRLIVRRQVAQQYSGSVLGFAWSYLQPGVRFLVYYFAIVTILRANSGTEQFAIHLFCGLVCVQYFCETFGSGTRSIWSNRGLVKKMAVPREIFPVASVVVSAIHVVPMIVILTGACLVIGFTPDVTGFHAAFVGFAMLTTFGIGTALLFSAANVYFRDFQNLVATIIQFMHFMVPMIYPYSRVSESAIGGTWVEQLYLANPVATAVLLVQRFFWVGVNSDPAAIAESGFPDHLIERGWIMLGIGLVFLAISQWVFSRLESKFPERL